MKKPELRPQCLNVCLTHMTRCVAEEGHNDTCLCSNAIHTPEVQRQRKPGVIEKSSEVAAQGSVWDNWKPAALTLFLLAAPAQAQELNLGVRNVFPRDSWTQGALLLGRPENFEIARTVLTATVPVGTQDFVVESTAGIPDGLLALIYDNNGRLIDGFDVIVTGPYMLHTDKLNRYQLEPGFTLQVAANVDPNGSFVQAPGLGGTLRKIIIKGREVLREELSYDSRGRLRGVRWRKIK